MGFLFDQNKFSAFNNDHFITLLVVGICFLVWNTLYYLGRFYSLYHEELAEYSIWIRGTDGKFEKHCLQESTAACLFLGFTHTFMMSIEILIRSVLFFFNHILFYLFFAYVFYFALPSIHKQYLQYKESNIKKE